MKRSIIISILLASSIMLYSQYKDDAVYTRKISSNTLNEYNEIFNERRTLFVLEGGYGNEILSNTPVNKLLIIEHLKIKPNLALGLGFGIKSYNRNRSFPAFVSLQFPKITNKANLSMFGLKVGSAWNYYYGYGNNLLLNASYNYGFRVSKKSFITLGGDIDYQSHGAYVDDPSFTFGLTLGFVH
jgi:hypothetical protein